MGFGESDGATNQLIIQLFARPHHAYETWVRFHADHQFRKYTIPPLIMASHDGLNTVVEYLIDSEGANVNGICKEDILCSSDSFYSPLIAASFRGHEGTVELLLDRGADIDLYNSSRRTALYAASWFGHKDVVELLLDRGAELAGRISEDGRYYSNLLEEAFRRKHQDTVDLLLSRGATWAEPSEIGLPWNADEGLLFDMVDGKKRW